MVAGLVPAMPSSAFFTPKPQNKRQIRAKQFKDCISTNTVQRSSSNNDRTFIVPNTTCNQYRDSFFVRTVMDWNQLDNKIVTVDTVGSFKRAIGKID